MNRLWHTPWILMALPLSVGLATSADPVVLDRAELQRAEQTGRVEGKLGMVRRLVESRETDRLVELLESVLVDSALTAVERERILHEGALGLAGIPPNDRAGRLLDRLATHEPAVFIWLEEDRHHLAAVPAYDVGATARLSRRFWHQRAAEQQALDLLEQHPGDFVAMLADQPDQAPGELEGMRAALERCAVEDLIVQRDALSAALNTDPRVDLLAAVTARRLADPELFAQVLRQGRTDNALRTLPDIVAVLSSPQAVEVLQAAISRPEIASAALLQMGRLAIKSSEARAILFDHLADPSTGGSAAMALARLSEPAIVLELGTILDTDSDETRRRRALLALKLDGSTAAIGELQRYAADPHASPMLRQEIKRWLAD